MGNDTPPPDTRVLLQLDSRGRISLGELAAGCGQYLATVEHDGTILLQPAIVMTQAELALAKNSDLSAHIERTLTNPATRVQRARPQRTGEGPGTT